MFSLEIIYNKCCFCYSWNKLNIWSYTGFKFEYILENKDKRIGWKDLLNSIDVLVDGKFEIDKKDDKLKFRGSSNQRIINVPESLKKEKIVILNL